jgi:hypothetical protein
MRIVDTGLTRGWPRTLLALTRVQWPDPRSSADPDVWLAQQQVDALPAAHLLVKTFWTVSAWQSRPDLGTFDRTKSARRSEECASIGDDAADVPDVAIPPRGPADHLDGGSRAGGGSETMDDETDPAYLYVDDVFTVFGADEGAYEGFTRRIRRS